MGTHELKQQTVQKLADQLVAHGFTVYLAKSGTHGLYTDGQRVVSFQSEWIGSAKFSGNYQSKRSGTGWQLAESLAWIDKEMAETFIKASAPRWATTEQVKYTTPEQHLKTYGPSSGYTLYQPSKEA
jgi:hypothetical protein